MSGKHNENTRLLGFYADKDLVDKANQVRGGMVMSQFLRAAVCDYISARGVRVPSKLRDPVDRTGKGGPAKKEKRLPRAKLKAIALKELARLEKLSPEPGEVEKASQPEVRS